MSEAIDAYWKVMVVDPEDGDYLVMHRCGSESDALSKRGYTNWEIVGGGVTQYRWNGMEWEKV